MSIKDDILSLAQYEENLFKAGDRYIQALATPEKIPAKNSTGSITELRQPGDEVEKIQFIPTAKDYQFEVSVWSRIEDGKTSHGFTITAKRDLGDGVIETITKEGNPLGE